MVQMEHWMEHMVFLFQTSVNYTLDEYIGSVSFRLKNKENDTFMFPADENTTDIVYHTDPMYQTGKYIKDNAEVLDGATQAFWRGYQITTSSMILPQSFHAAFALFMDTCEQPLLDLLAQRRSLGTALENAATQAINLEDALQDSFKPVI